MLTWIRQWLGSERISRTGADLEIVWAALHLTADESKGGEVRWRSGRTVSWRWRWVTPLRLNSGGPRQMASQLQGFAGRRRAGGVSWNVARLLGEHGAHWERRCSGCAAEGVSWVLPVLQVEIMVGDFRGQVQWNRSGVFRNQGRLPVRLSGLG